MDFFKRKRYLILFLSAYILIACTGNDSNSGVPEDSVFGGERVRRQPVELPGAGLRGARHELGEVEAPREGDLFDLDSRDPVSDEAEPVLRREGTAVAHEGGGKDAVTDQLLVLGVQVDQRGLPTCLLSGEAGDEPVSAIDLDLEAVQLGLEGGHRAGGLVVGLLELGQLGTHLIVRAIGHT